MIVVAVWIKFGSEKWSELLVTPILKPCYNSKYFMKVVTQNKFDN